MRTYKNLALVRLAFPVVRIFIDTRTLLDSVRNADDVWTAAEEMLPLMNRISELAHSDDWNKRARVFPKPARPNRVARPDRADEAKKLSVKYGYFIELFLSSPYTGKGNIKDGELTADLPPFLRRIGGYDELMPTLLLALTFDSILPMMSNDARSIVYKAADDALDQMISFALAIEGNLAPPPDVILPEPMPVMKMYDDWKRALQIRRTSDVVPYYVPTEKLKELI